MQIRIIAGFAMAVATGCGSTSQTGAAAADRSVSVAGLPACAPDNGGLTLPTGFCAAVVHEGVGPARHISVTPDGRVYVALRDVRGETGGIVGLRDTDGDGILDEMVRFGDRGGTGIAVRGEYLYFAPNTAVVRYRLPADGALEPQGSPETIVDGFPEQRGHAAKTLAFGDDGSLWVNVGGPSNACQEPDRQPGVRGQDPCPQLDLQAGVWRYQGGTPGQKHEAGARWATGIRNAVALAYNPADRGLYAVQHGRDQLDMWDAFEPAENTELPSEEFIRVEQGANFGWPYCYHDPGANRRVLAPEYGGDGVEVGRCAAFAQPLTAYPAHWAPNDLLFYSGGQFPQSYRGGAFIAWHGSWNRSPPQRGYKITFQPMTAGGTTGEWEVFADGFAGDEVLQSSGDARHRPMGLAEGPDGTLYVVDSKEGTIWRIIYRGS
ncbi:sorbosone dehydrogenase family protein [soil metagenome]